MTVDLLFGTVSGGDAAGDRISDFENLQGSDSGDTLTLNAAGGVINGGDGDDVMNGHIASDTLNGGNGIDTINGGDGDDIINGGSSIDTINGGNGNDTILVTGTAFGDNIDGGADIDTLDLSGVGAGIAHSVDLAAGTWQENVIDIWTIVNVENVTGSEFDNTITGDGNANTLAGGGGSDTLAGGTGSDTLIGGTETDVAVFSGAWLNYQITEGPAGTFTLVDTRASSPDGTDLVSAVENFQFANGTFTAAQLLNDAPLG